MLGELKVMPCKSIKQPLRKTCSLLGRETMNILVVE